MSRRRAAKTRLILPDAQYNSTLLAKFINNLMKDGEKSIAESIVYGALAALEERYKLDGLEIFLQAIDNVKPEIEVRSRRVGGATYQVPVDIRENRKVALSIRWIIKSAKSRKERTMKLRLMNELWDAYNKKGKSIDEMIRTHKMAEANKAFAHFRW
ncbi:MAG: 30S ribosomal protein S7 [Pseudomonadota bacterium]